MEETFWDIVSAKDSIQGIMHALKDSRNAPLESMARVDLHNATVELNSALAKLLMIIEREG